MFLIITFEKYKRQAYLANDEVRVDEASADQVAGPPVHYGSGRFNGK